MSEALIVRDDSRLSVAFTEKAIALRERALEIGALIGRVTNAIEQEAAVGAQVALAEVLNLVEKARQKAKEPILEFGRALDVVTKGFVLELNEEQMRIAKEVGDFQALEAARIRELQKLENDRLAQIEREKLQALAEANTFKKREEIQEAFAFRAAEEPPQRFEPVRAAGQIVKEEIEFEVTDIWTLARSHPTCVTIEPRRSEIKSLLSAGVKLAGVRSWQATKATVRRGEARARGRRAACDLSRLGAARHGGAWRGKARRGEARARGRRKRKEKLKCKTMKLASVVSDR